MGHIQKGFQIFKKRKKEVYFSLVTGLFVLIICIIVIEVYFWKKNENNWVCEICKFDSELGWTTIPNTKVTKGKITYTTNSMGFRSDEVDPSKEHILVIGDSVAFGLGVNDDETVSYYLSQKLKKYQVLNLAVPGYSIDQYYLTLKRHISKTKPKLIIVVLFSGNDWVETGQNHIFGISKPFFEIDRDEVTQINPNISKFSCNHLFSRSKIFKMVSLIDWCDLKALDDISTKKVIKEILRKINDLAVKNQSKLLWVLSPTLFDLLLNACDQKKSSAAFCIRNKINGPSFLIKRYQKLKRENPEMAATKFKSETTGFGWLLLNFQEVLGEGKFHFVDHFSEISHSDVNASQLFNQEPFHYSPRGNRFLAKTIFENLKIKEGEIYLRG